jgi:hypothetical protein
MQVTISAYTAHEVNFLANTGIEVPVHLYVSSSKIDWFELKLPATLVPKIDSIKINTFVFAVGDLSFEKFEKDEFLQLKPVITVSSFNIIANSKDVSAHGSLSATPNLIILNSEIDNDKINGLATDSSGIPVKFTATASEFNRNTLIPGVNLVAAGKFRLAAQEGIGLLIENIIAVIPTQVAIEPTKIPNTVAPLEPVLNPAQKAKATKSAKAKAKAIKEAQAFVTV